MIVYVNGDSHSTSNGMLVGNSYPELLTSHLNAQLINQAKVGGSNQRILRTTQDFLKTKLPDLVVIGWSTWEREEWLHNETFYDVNSSGHVNLPEELVEQYKRWVIEQTPETVQQKSRELHTQIYQLHLTLTEKNIPHVFFNCMYNVFGITPEQELIWNDCYIYPYKNDYSYYWYLRNRGFVSDEWFHFKQDGHRAWAEFLIGYIEEHDIIR